MPDAPRGPVRLTLHPSPQIQAEEKFGLQGFRYLGNGKYEAAPGAVINQQPPSYGAVN